MEATFCSEMPVDFQRITRRYIPEDRTVDSHIYRNLVWNYIELWAVEMATSQLINQLTN
jgi:hypothetical protein